MWQAVKLHVMDSNPNASSFENDMPDGWRSLNGLTCSNSSEWSGYRARGYNPDSHGDHHLENARVTCTIVVYHFDDGWFLTTFLFWSITILSNMLGGLGLIAYSE